MNVFLYIAVVSEDGLQITTIYASSTAYHLPVRCVVTE